MATLRRLRETVSDSDKDKARAAMLSVIAGVALWWNARPQVRGSQSGRKWTAETSGSGQRDPL